MPNTPWWREQARKIDAAAPGSRAARAAAGAAAAAAAWEGSRQIIQAGRGAYDKRMTFTLTVAETDPIYADVREWLSGLVPGEKLRTIAASTDHSAVYNDSDEFAESDYSRSRLRLSFDDRHPKRIVVDGHAVRAKVVRADSDSSSTGDNSSPAGWSNGQQLAPMCVEFTARTRAAQEAVVAHLKGILARQNERRPVLRMVDKWGNWAKRSDLPLRGLESVILPLAQKAFLAEDLRSFLDAEKRYLELAIPWHRGYLLHGAPGTGKTSMVKALANEFRMDLWYVSLADLKEESSLITLLAGVGPRSILLLEDVDTIQITHSREEKPAGASPVRVTLSALLNALDGVATPHGLVTIMTTNHYDRLDPALTRAGRMDVVEEFRLPGPDEADELFARFYGERLDAPRPSEGDLLPLSQAELSELFKRNLDDPDGARSAFWEALKAGDS